MDNKNNLSSCNVLQGMSKSDKQARMRDGLSEKEYQYYLKYRWKYDRYVPLSAIRLVKKDYGEDFSPEKQKRRFIDGMQVIGWMFCLSPIVFLLAYGLKGLTLVIWNIFRMCFIAFFDILFFRCEFVLFDATETDAEGAYHGSVVLLVIIYVATFVYILRDENFWIGMNQWFNKDNNT